MKISSKSVLSLTIYLFIIFSINNLFAGNEQRAGQAGAHELLINPWARSSGWGGANTACVRGIEAVFMNVAGISFTEKTELLFSRSEYLVGTGISINSLGFSQKVGETGVLGISLNSMSFGEINVTTVELPEGGAGTFNPQFMTIGLSYAKAFSNSIFGGFTIKVVNEKPTADVAATGLAIDAGLQYIAPGDKLKFGISLKNVGTPMKFNGDGLTFRGFEPNNNYNMTVVHRSEYFELPSLINIGLSYDISLDSIGKTHRITPAVTFTSNSFTNDQYAFGVEYGYKNLFMIRGGYTYEKNLNNDEKMTFFSGPSAGFTFKIPLNKNGSTADFDYSFRAASTFTGAHTFGLRINL